MLSDEVINKVIDRLVNRIEQGNEFVLKTIGNNIKKIGTLSASDAQRLEQILKYGGDYEKIANKLSEITRLNVKDIYEIFEEVAKNDLNFASKFYKYRNKKFIPYEHNTALKNQVEALARVTANEYVNISRTMAFARVVDGKVTYSPLAQAYQEIIDEAILNVAQGKETFDREMYRLIKEIGSSGLKTINYPSGRHMRLDSAIRMQMGGALRNLHNQTQQIFGQEFGADGVEISVHEYPAPDHADAQGKQFSYEEYEKLQTTGIGKTYKGETINLHLNLKSENATRLSFRPISQYNCYHYEFAIVLGVSDPEYSDDELKTLKEANEKGFEYEGKKYTMYEGTQLQRKIETEMRKQKDIQIMAKESGQQDLVNESQLRINQLTTKYKELSNISGLPTRMERARVSGYKRAKIK